MSRRRIIMMLFSFSNETRSFISRVEADGGSIESPACIDDKLELI